jgi:hypothetical protein
VEKVQRQQDNINYWMDFVGSRLADNQPELTRNFHSNPQFSPSPVKATKDKKERLVNGDNNLINYYFFSATKPVRFIF